MMKQMTLKSEYNKKQKQNHDGPDIDSQASTFWNRFRREP